MLCYMYFFLDSERRMFEKNFNKCLSYVKVQRNETISKTIYKVENKVYVLNNGENRWF
jgi:hypothetical protein